MKAEFPKTQKRRSIKTLDKQIERLSKEVKVAKLSASLEWMNSREVNAYRGASRTDRNFRNYDVTSGNPDSQSLGELPILRARANDLYRNNSIARGAVLTATTSVIGSGVQLQSTMTNEVLSERLGWDEDQISETENILERKWHEYISSYECDANRRMTFHQLETVSFKTFLNSGECFATLPYVLRKGSRFPLKINLIDPNDVSNPFNMFSNKNLRDGIELDNDGTPIAYHIQTNHNLYELNQEWKRIPAFGEKTGRKNVLHIFNPDFIGQSRGVPWIAPVIQDIKTLGDFNKNKAIKAAVENLFVGFIKTNRANGIEDVFKDEVPRDFSSERDRERDLTLEPGLIQTLDEGEDIGFHNPTANQGSEFMAFNDAMCQYIAIGLGLPKDMVTKVYNASFTASKASRMEAFRYFLTIRNLFVSQFHNPIYQEFVDMLVEMEEIDIPGYFEDEEIRHAVLCAEWVGESPGQIDPVRETTASILKINNALSTRHAEAIKDGMDFDTNIRKLKRENKQMLDSGLAIEQPTLFPERSEDRYSNEDGNDIKDTQESRYGSRKPKLKIVGGEHLALQSLWSDK
jgi:lambda family phage portal protein